MEREGGAGWEVGKKACEMMPEHAGEMCEYGCRPEVRAASELPKAHAADLMPTFYVDAPREPLTLTMCAVVAMTACRVSIVHSTWRGKRARDGGMRH